MFAIIQRGSIDRRPSKPDRAFVTALASFALPLAPITLLAWANNNITLVILRSMLGFAALGTFSAALSLAGTIKVIQAGFNAYWAPFVYRNYKRKDNKFWSIHRAVASILVVFVLLLVLAQDIVFLLLGEKYRGAAEFFPFLLVTPMCYTLAATTGLGIEIKKKTYWNTLIYLMSAAVSLALCLVLIPNLGVNGAAIAAATSGLVYVTARTIIGESYFRSVKHYWYLVATLGLTLLAAVVSIVLYQHPVARLLVVLGLFLAALAVFRAPLASMGTLALGIARTQVRRLRGGKNSDQSGQASE
jgi:O-antigen/teichoic acid export membrane protein